MDRAHSLKVFLLKVVQPSKRNIMSCDQSERSKWSPEQAQRFNFTYFFLIIIIIIRCSGMFGMFHVPGFIDDPSFVIKDYLKVLKLFPVTCRYGWQEWKWT